MQHSLKPARGGIAGLRTVALQESEPPFKICERRRPDAGPNWLDRRFGPTANGAGLALGAPDARTMIADAFHGFSGSVSDK